MDEQVSKHGRDTGGTSFSLKEEGDSDTGYHVDGPRDVVANDTNSYKKSSSICTRYRELQFINTESRMVVARVGGKVGKGSLMGSEFQVCNMERVLRLVAQLCKYA